MNTKTHARRLEIAYPLAGQIVAAFSFGCRVCEASILDSGYVSLDWMEYENLPAEPRAVIAMAYCVALRFVKHPSNMRVISVDDTDWFGSRNAETEKLLADRWHLVSEVADFLVKHRTVDHDRLAEALGIGAGRTAIRMLPDPTIEL